MRTRWSQNFLIDNNIARKCVQSLNLFPDDYVLEIGPGKGVLTRLLLENIKKLVAIEIDPALCNDLKEKFGDSGKISLINKDILEVDFSRYPIFKSHRFKVIGNLPYAVVSPILQKMMSWFQWDVSVFMAQKEVGERIRAVPGTKDYGILSVSVQSRCKVEKICTVSGFCFRPAPKVESMVLRFFPLPHPFFKPEEEKNFFSVVRGCFAHRRKTILNSLSLSLKIPPLKISTAIEKCGLSPMARAETLTINDFQNLSKMLYNS